MRRIFKLLFAGSTAALLTTAAYADSLGVVFVHGKQGRPMQFERIAEAFSELGWQTERPEMCWSRTRIYDQPYLDCLGDIDTAIGRLRDRGATNVVIVGMSLGGNGVLGYGARHSGLKGVIALAPAHAPEFISLRPDIAQSLVKARAMIAEGRGDATDEFADVNTGEGTSSINFAVKTSAKIYVSFFAPESAAVMTANAGKLTAPLLLVSGINDPTQRGSRNVFQSAPPDPMNRFVSVDATHMGTPAAARPAMVEWLKEIAAR